MQQSNELTIELQAIGENESLARIIVAAYVAKLNPTMEELSDLKVAVSEAVTNAIIHGYEGSKEGGKIRMVLSMDGRMVTIQVQDYGKGIPDIEKAMEPLYTTKPEQERSGMGFSFMEAFTNELLVESESGEGTMIIMKKMIGE